MSDTPDAGPLLPECEFAADIPRDAQGCLPVGALTAASGCRIAQAECFTLMSPDNFGGKRKKEKHMAKSPKKPVVEEPPPPAEDVAAEADAAAEEKTAPLPGPPQAPAAVQAHVEVPASSTATAELQALLPKDGSGGSAVTVMMALIAVAGGGAGWKFYQSFAKQKHEQRMKELEIKEKRLEQHDDKNDHKACEAARAVLEARVAALEAKPAPAQTPEAAPSVSLPFDPEELEQRLSEIEKALKKDTSKKAKKP